MTAITVPLRALATLVIMFVLAGCATLDMRTPYTAMDAEVGAPMGIPGVRMWADGTADTFEQLIREFRGRPDQQKLPAINILALSGGAEDGAFGAGLLNGWTASGQRPAFTLVTGISTGALIAPFAYLGSDYDEPLKQVYTQTTLQDIVSGNPIAGLFGGQGIFSTAPLQRMVAEHVDEKMLEAVAAAHRSGRRLLVVTTNLDAQRPVLWNMGAIANSGSPHALELFRRVLVASASIPGAFTPMMIEVERDGKTFKEMHVDGGTTMQVLAVPTKIAASPLSLVTADRRVRNFYIVINKKVTPEFAMTKPSTLAIASRGFDTLLKSDTYGTLVDAYQFARENGYRYSLAYIPDSFAANEKRPFDRDYMNKLYAFGFAQGKAGGGWVKVPPNLYN